MSITCHFQTASLSNSRSSNSNLVPLQTSELCLAFRRGLSLTDAMYAQVFHCGMGMVGSINAPTNGTNTHEAFVAKAKAIGSSEISVSCENGSACFAYCMLSSSDRTICLFVGVRQRYSYSDWCWRRGNRPTGRQHAVIRCYEDCCEGQLVSGCCRCCHVSDLKKLLGDISE